VGGGTLGHIYPVLPVVSKLKARDPKLLVYFIGTKTGLEREFLNKSEFFAGTYFLDSKGFKRKISFENLLTLYKYFRNYFLSRKLLKEIKPDIVVGMGGYVSGAVLKAATKMKIRTAIHEQNAVYGLANKFLKKKVDRVLLAFDIEKNEKTRLVGNPRTSEIYERYKREQSLTPERTVLVVGGSRGAERINDIIIALKEEFLKANIKVILITGNLYYRKNIEKINQSKGPKFIIKSFVRNLPELMLSARVVVTRSGATTLAEIMALRKVCLLIPSPNVTANHQEKNALEIVKKEGALMIRESEMTKDSLFTKILQLLDDKDLRRKIITNLTLIADVDACDKFIKELDEMMAIG
jgi:UDP-N-acetylglucosamine--N-acetylmuramyl-(pentapeptide) pyrophosphoryl-undecaprenol N-acetylglucosamine transferase